MKNGEKERRRIRGRIAERFVTSVEFARAVPVHPSKISRYLRGHIDLKPAERRRWASALGVEVDELFREGAE